MATNIIFNTASTRNDLKLSGAALCTAGRLGKLVAGQDLFVTPVSATTDTPYCVFLKTVTASDTTWLGKDQQVAVALEGAVIETTEYDASDAPVVASPVYWDSTGKIKGGTSGGSTFAAGVCTYNDDSKIQYELHIDKAADF